MNCGLATHADQVRVLRRTLEQVL